MEQLVVLLFGGALLVQIPLAILVAIDARRLDLENPTMYELGILVPMGGLAVVAAYLYNRNSLPSKSAPIDRSSGNDGSGVQLKTKVAFIGGLLAWFVIVHLVRAAYM